jgi:hypothetical protein
MFGINFKKVKEEVRKEWEKETARLLVFGGYRSDIPVDPECIREEHDDDLPGGGLFASPLLG